MALLRNRTFILALSVALLIGFLGVLGWRLAAAHEIGWTGLQYTLGIPDEQRKKMPDFGPFSPRPGQVMVVANDSPAERAGVRAGDSVIAVNGIPIVDQKRLTAVERASRRGTTLTYRIRSVDGSERNVRLTSVSPLSLSYTVAGMSVGVFVTLVFVIVSMIVVYQTATRTRAAFVFYCLCTVTATFFAVDVLRELDITPYVGITAMTSQLKALGLYLLYALLAFLVWSLLLHLALVFPKEHRIVREHPMILRWVHTVLWFPIVILVALGKTAISAAKTTTGKWIFAALLLAALAACVVYIWRKSKTWRTAVFDHPWLGQFAVAASLFGVFILTGRLVNRENAVAVGIAVAVCFMLVYFALLFGFAIATIATMYIGYRNSNVEEKRQVRWPLWGTMVAVSIALVVPTAIMLVTWLSDGYQNMTLMLVATITQRLAYVLIPVSFAFGILKYRLMEIDVIIKKTVVYTAVTGVVVAAFFILVAGVGTLVTSYLQIRSQAVTIVATLVLALAFVPLRNRVQRFVDRRFFRRKYEASEAQKLIQRDVLAATELPPLLKKTAEYVQQVLQTRSVIVLVETEDRDRFAVGGAIGVPDDVARNLVFERDAFARVDAIVPATSLRLPQDDWARMRKVSAELFVPARLRGELRGALIVGSMLSGSFDDDDRAFLESTAQQIALGIDNLSVTDEVRDYERALEIQRALMPRTMPRAEGVEIDAAWKPARTVGGDYFDVFSLDATTLGLCIADVAGKGMPAALLMASLQAAVKASATAEMSPSEVCAKVRNVVCGTLAGGRFVTFFFGMLDTNRMVLRYVNAGHNPPLLVKGDGRVVRLDAGGPAFARLMQETPYITSEESLEANDTLVLFTDGVTEARNAEQEEFGDERLVEVVRRAQPAARNVVRDIVDDVHAFSGGIAHDDVTILCVRITRGGAENVVPFTKAAS